MSAIDDVGDLPRLLLGGLQNVRQRGVGDVDPAP